MTTTQTSTISPQVISKTFWYCEPIDPWPDVLVIIQILIDLTGTLLNAFTGYLLFSRAKRGPWISIGLLRTAIVTFGLFCFFNFLGDVNPKGLTTTNTIFNTIVCFFWSSRLVYWLLMVIGVQAIVFFSLDRAIILRKLEKMRFTSPDRRFIYYQVFICTYSVFMVIPQVLTVNLTEEGCPCAPKIIRIPHLSVIYAHVYVWVFLMLLFDGSLLLFAACQIIIWRRDLPLKQQKDDLNYIRGSVDDNLAPLEKIRGWNTASMSVFPLAVAYVITFAFDALHQFVCAVSDLSYAINSVPQRLGHLLLVIFSNTVPVLLLVYIPALRNSVKAIFKRKRRGGNATVVEEVEESKGDDKSGSPIQISITELE